MAALHCSCEQKHQIWAEFWWIGGKHDWIFFDNQEISKTYAERLTHCPGCSQRLERENLKTIAQV